MQRYRKTPFRGQNLTSIRALMNLTNLGIYQLYCNILPLSFDHGLMHPTPRATAFYFFFNPRNLLNFFFTASESRALPPSRLVC